MGKIYRFKPSCFRDFKSFDRFTVKFWKHAQHELLRSSQIEVKSTLASFKLHSLASIFVIFKLAHINLGFKADPFISDDTVGQQNKNWRNLEFSNQVLSNKSK